MTGQENADILGSIGKLVDAEKQLRARIADGTADEASAREDLAALEIKLDQCWDLLRQRRARTEFGEDPGTARVRPAAEVEGYES
ncbi:hypothetical protein F4556_005516 [Kitasatospora gansuensis]|uniref:DUF2630 domain-containing protein n=1 Tax=Kitasatospora gansuensis TaxID=258050 RepID=A0A7W7WK43_9ACTN|nr:DUF2630 family protein [Kitasatospora gansuensis]MBB4949981.1 hypothetical protein [Kitasatospora gansuensis]